MPSHLLPYNQPLSLLTDLYQLTMAYGYWRSGTHNKEAVFNLFFRKNPFEGGFTIACGLAYAIEYLKNLAFDSNEIDYLATLTGNDGRPLFSGEFMDYLSNFRFEGDVAAIPEGTAVFPFEPLMRVQGPIIQCQFVETALLNIINFQTLIATKAARLFLAAGDQPVLEFGLRRAQGIDGALAASRAAYIGGCSATSNVLAGKMFGIPVKGTHAHSWVMSFPDEQQAFRQYAKAMPNNCVFLVDTYDTLDGVRQAIEIGRELRIEGHEMLGIRLDSGDLAYLSIEARKILDESGFPQARIVASNDLDEKIISSLKAQGAKIDIWGVGTKLVTGYDQPALGGVYKLAAIRDDGQDWSYKIKLSEQSIKVSNPGIQQVRRFSENGQYLADAIYDETTPPAGDWTIVDQLDPTRRKKMPAEAVTTDLLVPVFEKGKKVHAPPDIHATRQTTLDNLAALHAGIKRPDNSHQYPVGLEKNLFDKKRGLIMKTRGQS